MTGPPYNVDNTPIYSMDMDDNVLGMAQSNGSILVNKNVSPLELQKNKTISHEMVHIDQMKRGDLDYTILTLCGKVKSILEQLWMKVIKNYLGSWKHIKNNKHA